MKAKIETLIFKRSDLPSGEVSLTVQMLNVLGKLDGQTNVGIVAGQLNMSLIEIRDVLMKLGKMGLVTLVQQQPQKATFKVVAPSFLTFVEKQLAQHMGPIAQLLITETIESMGEAPGAFPQNRIGELIAALAANVPGKEKQDEFINSIRLQL